MTRGVGPLAGVKVVEFGAIGPVPFAAMVLADLGADVVIVERPGKPGRTPRVERARADIPKRGRRSIVVDLKSEEGRTTALELIVRADIVLEGNRPGVLERLGLGPDVCLERNPRLVLGRMTGWGQGGPLAQQAGHDINYISVAGTLDNLRRDGELPNAPLNLVGDYGGGAMLLLVGVLAALSHSRSTGQGQVVDAAMVDGSSLLMTLFYGYLAEGRWSAPGANFLDGAAPYYGVYECADGKYLSLGAIEPQFYAALLDGLGFDPATLPEQDDKAGWPATKAAFADRIKERTRDEWAQIFEGTDACVSAVLSLTEAPHHPHNVARGVFIERDGHLQPAPAPRFSATPTSLGLPPPWAGEHTEEVLRDWGL